MKAVLGAEHDSCKILAQGLLRSPGGSQNPESPSQTGGFRPTHGPVTRSVMKRVLKNQFVAYVRSARLWRFARLTPDMAVTNDTKGGDDAGPSCHHHVRQVRQGYGARPGDGRPLPRRAARARLPAVRGLSECS